MRTRQFVSAGLLCLAVSSAAFAAPADDAQDHFKAIAKGDIGAVMSDYADNIHFEWVGGPLNGTYVGSGPAGTGKGEIQAVWARFAKANGPMEVSVGRLETSGNDAGSTVTANVEFKGRNTIKVRYALVYRGGKIASEVWQIDPKLGASSY